MEDQKEVAKTKTSGDVPGFDFRTEIKDPKTGQIIQKQDYRLRISKDEGSLYERPIGSGIWYNVHNDIVKTEKKPELKAGYQAQTVTK